MWGIIPAYAGSTRRQRPVRDRRSDHPRIRGEHWRYFGWLLGGMGSSPHTRGALTPRILVLLAHLDHPRIRGEHSGLPLAEWRRAGSSPHTRGAPASLAVESTEVRIIPAYAGSTRAELYEVSVVADHPRIRGEHPSVGDMGRDGDLVGGDAAGSSPHTRGARDPQGRKPPVFRIIPAYAGSTLCLSRGRGRCRIIPAYAGSTLGNPCNTKDRRRDYTSFPLPVTHPSGGGGS